MERPFANHHDFDQSPFEGDGGSVRRPNLSRAAGHIITRGESAPTSPRPHPRSAEALIAAALNQDSAPAEKHDVQYSSWHRVEMDESGKALDLNEQNYGQEFYAQSRVEQNDPGTVAGQTPQSSDPVAPVQPTAQFAQPIMPAQYTTPQVAPQATDTPQPVQLTPQTFVVPSAMPQKPAVSPVAVPTPHMEEPRLAPGAPTTIDPQHRLPAPHPVKRVLQNPWTWLVVGVAMIIYFTT